MPSYNIGDNVSYGGDTYQISSIRSLGVSKSYVLKKGNYSVAVFGEKINNITSG